METNICFVCLQKLPNLFSANSNPGPPLNLKFCKFATNYLGIQNFRAGARAAFCDNCEKLVSSVCKLFLELISVQLRISSELGVLAEQLKCSESNSSQLLKMTKSLAQQLQVRTPAHLSKLRKLLKTKCEQKRKESLPHVILDGSMTKEYDKLMEAAWHWKNNTEFESEVLCQSERVACLDAIPMNVDDIGNGGSVENETLFQPDVFSSSDSDASTDSDSDESTCSSISSSKYLRDHADAENKSLGWSQRNIKPIERGDGELACPKCPKVFPTRGKTRAHIYQRHSKKKYRCPECNIIVKRKEVLQKHIVAFHKSQNHICHSCEKIFKTAKYLIEHIHRTHPDSTVPQHNWPKCEKCHRLFRRKVGLEQHSSKCDGIETTIVDKKKYCCSEKVCSKSFPTRHSLSMHVLAAHKPKLTFANIAHKFSKL